jgi:type IX secretion system PorP/SprF family membrane protein
MKPLQIILGISEMCMKKGKQLKVVVLTAMLLSGIAMHAQDAHFSQIYSTPLLVNPAMTGIFDGTFRLSNAYRAQWSSFGDAYKTLHISADLPLSRSRFKNHYFGAGLMLVQDKAGAAKFSNTIIEGALSYTTSVDDGDNFIALGFRTGIDSREIDLTKATWDNQWNGDVFDPNRLSGETVPYQQRTYFDFTAGLMWYYIPDGRTNVCFGGSVAHLSSPDLSYTQVAKDILKTRILIHGSAELCMDANTTFWIVPRVFAQFQGNQSEILAGGYIKERLELKSKYTNFRKDIFFSVGALYRVDDAIILSTRFEYSDFGVGISYDFTVSELASMVGGTGGPEFSLYYTPSIKRGQKDKNYNKNPRYF